MIYDNATPARLDLDVDGVIPPLTPCDPKRRKYTTTDVLCVGDWLLGSAEDTATADGLLNYGNALTAYARAKSGVYVITLP